MAIDTSRLVSLRNQVDAAKQRKAQLEGRREELMNSIRKTFKCKTVREAEALAAKMMKELEAMEKEFNAGLKALNEAFPDAR